MAYPRKSKAIADTITAWFAEKRYKPGDRFPSDQELAKLFGVNHITVRTALRQFVAAGLLERRVGTGTVVRDPAAAPAASKAAARATNPSVALALPDATHSFFSEMLHAVEAALLGGAHPLLFGHTWELHPREAKVVGTWIEQGVRRMILTPTAQDAGFYRQLLEKGVRLVFVDRKVPGVDVPSIVSRDELGMSQLVAHLVAAGHRRLVHLAGPGGIWTAQQRQVGFERAARAADLGPADALVRPAGYFLEDGYRATVELLQRGPLPAAIVAANDPVAVGAVRALQERGLSVPGDVVVTGYGDTDLGRNFALTTVRQFPGRMGTEAVRLVLGDARVGEGDAVEIVPELVLR
jgi:DNA-binding LacI/PurR family transcriptional regulator